MILFNAGMKSCQAAIAKSELIKTSMNPVCLYTRAVTMLAIMLILHGCAPPLKQSGRLDLSTDVYIQPEKPVNLSNRKLLIAPIYLYTPQARDWVPSVTGLVQDVLSQERIFNVIVRGRKNFDSQETLLDHAGTQGFDYVMFASIPPVIFPAGNTSGWVGFDMKLVSTENHATLWHLYGQACLIPAPTKWSILGDAAYAKAPSVSEGVTTILHKMAFIIKCQNRGEACGQPE